MNLHHTLKKC